MEKADVNPVGEVDLVRSMPHELPFDGEIAKENISKEYRLTFF
jgi:hypothetical protein